MKVAKGEFFLLLNPDTVVQEDTFRVMLDFFTAHEDAGLAGCKVLNPDGTLQLACRRSFPTPWVAFTKIFGFSALFPKSSLFAKYNLEYRDPDQSYEVDAVSGSFMILRSFIFRQTGGFDEQFFMYGEDLDLCYRVQKEGWKVYYVHETQIIHYKGQSALRSDIDEVRHFYQSMRVFVKKHFRRDPFTDLILRTGIALREWVAFLARTSQPIRAALLDLVLIYAALFLAEYIRFGELLKFPASSYPAILTVMPVVIIGAMHILGVYTTRKLSASRAMNAVVVGYVILSALTFFFNQYAYSRMVVLISGGINILLLPGWRIIARSTARSPVHHRRSLFGRRTLIVGTGPSAVEVLRKLRARVDDGYEVVGFIDTTLRHVGEKVQGVEILGSIDNIGKVISGKKASEVIFSTDVLSYAEILSVIARTQNRGVNFRLVPNSLEVIIGKTHIDELDDIPLLDIEYNLHKPVHRITKRLFDLVLAALLLVTFYPLVRLKKMGGGTIGMGGSHILQVPEVLRGTMSFVGPPAHDAAGVQQRDRNEWGKNGITGLVQINYREDLTVAEIEKYNVYYAKNQSLMLDVEILVKSLLRSQTSRH
jgi:GT2 family glycosyltransferase